MSIRMIIVLACASFSALSGQARPAIDPDEKYLQAIHDGISTPVHYDDIILILTTKEGVAAVQFTKPFMEIGSNGMSYRYRFRKSGTAKEIRGEGKVYEAAGPSTIEELHGKKVKPEAQLKELFIRAGKVELPWSAGTGERGYVYYSPEKVRVQIASGIPKKLPELIRLHLRLPAEKKSNPLQEIDLSRFKW